MLYIVKFMKRRYFKDAIDHGRLRIGTFDYFREIGEVSLRDESEGAGRIRIVGEEMHTDVVRRVATSREPPPNTIVRFEVGEGSLVDDLSINCLIFCASCVEDLSGIQTLKDGPFADKDDFFFIVDEGLFEKRCGTCICQEIKRNRHNEPVFVYCFTGKVTYLDELKETVLPYEKLAAGSSLKINLRFFFEKPTRYQSEQEYRYVWICTNKPIDDGYEIYSMNEKYLDTQIDPTDCFSRTPVEYRPSLKGISVWDLNK